MSCQVTNVGTESAAGPGLQGAATRHSGGYGEEAERSRSGFGAARMRRLLLDRALVSCQVTNVGIESDAGPIPGRHFFPGRPPGRKAIMKLRILPSSLFLLIAFLTAQASSCGIIDPAPGPDDPLPLLRLNPEMLVSSVVQASTPDSSGSDSIAHMRFDLTSEAIDAVENGAIVPVQWVDQGRARYVRQQLGPYQTLR